MRRDRHNEENHVKMETEIGMIQLQAEGCQISIPRDFREIMTLIAP